MIQKVTRSAMFAVHVEINDGLMKAMARSPELILNAVQVCASYWHDTFLGKHFERGAAQRYGYTRRSTKYMNSQAKRGKPYLVLSGSLRDDLKSAAQFTQKSRVVELRMRARVLNLSTSMPENSDVLTVKTSDGKNYPNIKREVKVVARDESSVLSEIVTTELKRQFDAAKNS